MLFVKVGLSLFVLSVVLVWLSLACPFSFLYAPPEPRIRASASRLEADVNRIVTGFGSRNWTNVRGLALLSDYIAEEFRQTGASVSFQPVILGREHHRNVVAEYGPADGAWLVIGAHYDTFSGLPGADDNASGVAGLIELGRLLAQEPPDIPVMLVAYTGEEPPFFSTPMMGSAVHAKSLKASGREVRLMISLEMIGYFSSQPDSQDYPVRLLKRFYPSRGNFIAVVGRVSLNPAAVRLKAYLSAAGTPAYSINAPRTLPGIGLSDHRSYWEQDYDALMVTDTAFERNPNYHTEEDLPESLDYECMANVVSGVHAFIHSLR